ncbi:YybH family protein [Endozoicomonas arenosclerae]|uniref:YybH family protein n=1 Tax=Endozoicomonas arenosclerae TaxID=1633495 RepID=UPI00078165F0|nr:nuclear transport factor 2 family protein [Endozoicomonas arenosclerae]
MKPEDIHQAFANALIAQDLEALANLYTEDAVFHPGHNKAPVQGRRQITKELEVFIPVAATMKPVDRTIIEKGNMALIKLVWKMTTEQGEEKQFNALEVLQKTGDAWQYAIDNPYGV